MLSIELDKLPNEMAPKAYVHIFRSPDFFPEQVRTYQASGIGSGTDITEFQQYLNELSNDHNTRFQMTQWETSNPGGMGVGLGFLLTRI